MRLAVIFSDCAGAVDMGELRITVTSPSQVDTPMTDLKAIRTPGLASPSNLTAAAKYVKIFDRGSGNRPEIRSDYSAPRFPARHRVPGEQADHDAQEAPDIVIGVAHATASSPRTHRPRLRHKHRPAALSDFGRQGFFKLRVAVQVNQFHRERL